MHSVGEAARDVWDKDHDVFYHDTLPPIKLDPSLLFKTQPCFDGCLCVCGKSVASRPDAMLFEKKLVDRMKMIFRKSKSKISEPRQLLERACIVLKFSGLSAESNQADGGSETENGFDLVIEQESVQVAYYLVAYANFQTWKFSGVELRKVCDFNQNGYLQLVPAAIDQPCSDHGVKTARQFAAECLDLTLRQEVLILRLAEEDQPLSPEHMVGSCVEVGPLKGSRQFTVWEGSDFEAKMRNQKEDRSKTRGPRKQDGNPERHKARHTRGPAKRQRRSPQIDLAIGDVDRLSDADFQDFSGSDGKDDCFGSNSDIDMDTEPDFAKSGSDSWPEESEVGSDELKVDFGDDSEQLHDSGSDGQANDVDLGGSLSGDGLLQPEAGIEEFFQYPDSPESNVVPDALGVAPDALTVVPDAVAVPGAPGSSSSSSSSSSSDSSDSDSSKPNKAYEPRRAPISELKMAVGEHELHFNLSGEYLRAHCNAHPNCRRQRTVLPSSFATHNQGQGRPIGLLVDWLERANDFDSKASHMKAKAPNHAQRDAARQRFKRMPNADEFLAVERVQQDDEYSEPDKIV